MMFLSPGQRAILNDTRLTESERLLFQEAFEAGWTLAPEHDEPPAAIRAPSLPRPLWADRKDVA